MTRKRLDLPAPEGPWLEKRACHMCVSWRQGNLTCEAQGTDHDESAVPRRQCKLQVAKQHLSICVYALQLGPVHATTSAGCGEQAYLVCEQAGCEPQLFRHSERGAADPSSCALPPAGAWTRWPGPGDASHLPSRQAGSRLQGCCATNNKRVPQRVSGGGVREAKREKAPAIPAERGQEGERSTGDVSNANNSHLGAMEDEVARQGQRASPVCKEDSKPGRM